MLRHPNESTTLNPAGGTTTLSATKDRLTPQRRPCRRSSRPPSPVVQRAPRSRHRWRAPPLECAAARGGRGPVSAATFHQKANVGHLVLRSPPTNFIGEGFNDDLRAAVHDVGESNSRALLITAEGPIFSLGGAPWEWSDKSSAWFRTFIAEVTASYRAIEALEFPVVAAIRGQTAGGGLELALCADFIVASVDTVLWCPEGMGGQVPMAGGYQRLIRSIGPVAARRMVMLAVPTPIGEVAGLAERVVVDGELDRTAAELATRLSNGPTRAYVAAKSLFRAYESGGVGTADRLLADVTAGLFDTEDSRAALA